MGHADDARGMGLLQEEMEYRRQSRWPLRTIPARCHQRARRPLDTALAVTLLHQGGSRAPGAKLTNVEFHEADVEADPYERWRPDLVTAHLCASDAIIERAARALAPGSCLAMVSFHVDQWKETGKVSRFAYDESRMRAALETRGFAVEALEVDRDVRRFDSVEEGLAAAVGLEDRWKADGRWFRYIAFLEGGGRTLTRSHLIVKGRRA